MDTESKIIPKTFLWMFLGLLATAGVAWYSYSSNLLINFIANGSWTILLIVEVVVVLLFSFLFKKLPAPIVGILYFVYAIINGITLSVIFYTFELNSIIYLFLASAALFGVLGFIGFKTEVDLSRWNVLFFGVLIFGVILSIINIFVGNSMLDLALDWIILITFFGVTIYDMKKIKELEYEEGIDTKKSYIYGAMQLYLDFINIFIRILSIFGKRRD